MTDEQIKNEFHQISVKHCTSGPEPALPHLLVFYWKINSDWTFQEEDISIRVQQFVKRCAAKQNIRSTNS